MDATTFAEAAAAADTATPEPTAREAGLLAMVRALQVENDQLRAVADVAAADERVRRLRARCETLTTALCEAHANAAEVLREDAIADMVRDVAIAWERHNIAHRRGDAIAIDETRSDVSVALRVVLSAFGVENSSAVNGTG